MLREEVDVVVDVVVVPVVSFVVPVVVVAAVVVVAVGVVVVGDGFGEEVVASSQIIAFRFSILVLVLRETAAAPALAGCTIRLISSAGSTSSNAGGRGRGGGAGR